ncbi:MAG TPA: AsmA-like C-terminal region-containing protein [Candidatus Eisenbacteria bacterium]|nr:AsmA-like C-terminal region-containing protein [Candidatus Eisenbacteria bacterium]
MPTPSRLVRIGLIAAGSLVGLVVLVLGLAYAFMPRDWIDKEARRQAALMSGAAVSWKSLEPGFDGLSIGVRISGLAVTMPKQGDPRLDLRAKEVFVRFRILPLLMRRVEIAAAKVSDAGIAMWDRGPLPQAPAAAPGSAPGPGMALVLPKLELDGIDVRTRDLFGGGIDLRRIRGTTEIEGTLDAPRAVRLEASAESLFWKGSARDPLIALPSPLHADIAMRGSGGALPKLDVTRGVVTLGPLKSDVRGSVTLPPAPAPARLDLAIVGAPQEIRSSDPAFRGFAAASPAAWSTKASWDVKIAGTAEAPVQSGSAKLAPLQVESGPNKFALDQVRADWSVTPDKRFTATADGNGSGVTLRLDMQGSTEPGGESNGTFQLDAPATRLNGLAPNTPTWASGALGLRAVFVNRAPKPPAVQWTLQGRDLSGTSPGVQPPIKRLQFALAGDMERVDVKSLVATIGSTTANVTGNVLMGKPLGTGTFTVRVDRFIAEEWSPPKGAAPATPAAGKGASAAPPPPIPFKRLTADVAVGELRQGTMTLRDVTVPVVFENGTLTMAPIRASMGTGTIAGALTLNDLVTKPSYAVKLDVVKAPVDELARGMIPFKLGLSGLVSGNVDLAGPGLPGPEVSDQLRGTLTGTVEQGKIAESEGLKQIRGALGLGNTSDVAFRTLSHVLRIEGGRLLLDKVKGDLGADKFELTGALGMDKSLNLGLLLRLAPERVKGNSTLAQFARLARDADGRLPVELGIGGTTDAPRVQLKAGKLLDVAGQSLKEELTKSLTKQLTPKTPPAAADSARGRGDSAAAKPDSAKQEDPLRKEKEALRRLLGK